VVIFYESLSRVELSILSIILFPFGPINIHMLNSKWKTG
jgi:hypothetical protein